MVSIFLVGGVFHADLGQASASSEAKDALGSSRRVIIGVA